MILFKNLIAQYPHFKRYQSKLVYSFNQELSGNNEKQSIRCLKIKEKTIISSANQAKHKIKRSFYVSVALIQFFFKICTGQMFYSGTKHLGNKSQYRTAFLVACQKYFWWHKWLHGTHGGQSEFFLHIQMMIGSYPSRLNKKFQSEVAIF